MKARRKAKLTQSNLEFDGLEETLSDLAKWFPLMDVREECAGHLSEKEIRYLEKAQVKIMRRAGQSCDDSLPVNKAWERLLFEVSMTLDTWATTAPLERLNECLNRR